MTKKKEKKNQQKKEIKIPVPVPVSTPNRKYAFGEAANRINEIKNHKPVFAFDYVSLNEGDLCFNTKLIKGHKEYHKLIDGLKRISGVTYEEMSKNTKHHFHDVDFNDPSVSISHSDFIKLITNNPRQVDPDKAPTVYQFKVFEEARILGFIYNFVFYLVMFDRNHKVYQRK